MSCHIIGVAEDHVKDMNRLMGYISGDPSIGWKLKPERNRISRTRDSSLGSEVEVNWIIPPAR